MEISQAIARVIAACEAAQETGRALRRLYYADPEKFGDALTHSHRAEIAALVRRHRAELIRRAKAGESLTEEL